MIKSRLIFFFAATLIVFAIWHWLFAQPASEAWGMALTLAGFWILLDAFKRLIGVRK